MADATNVEDRFRQLVAEAEDHELNHDSGIRGLNGKSAYEIATEHGYVGTETEWLASLTGVPGSAATVSIGKVDLGNRVSVTNVGTPTNAVLDIVIPEVGNIGLTPEDLAQMFEKYIHFDLAPSTGELDVTIDEVPQQTIAEKVAGKLLASMQFVVTEDGELGIEMGNADGN